MHNTELETSLKKAFGQAFQDELYGKKPDETVRICRDIVLTQKDAPDEERTGFWGYLSDVFRFDGFPILGLQAAVLLLVCLNISFIAKDPALMPIFMPLFALAILPVLFAADSITWPNWKRPQEPPAHRSPWRNWCCPAVQILCASRSFSGLNFA